MKKVLGVGACAFLIGAWMSAPSLAAGKPPAASKVSKLERQTAAPQRASQQRSDAQRAAAYQAWQDYLIQENISLHQKAKNGDAKAYFLLAQTNALNDDRYFGTVLRVWRIDSSIDVNEVQNNYWINILKSANSGYIPAMIELILRSKKITPQRNSDMMYWGGNGSQDQRAMRNTPSDEVMMNFIMKNGDDWQKSIIYLLKSMDQNYSPSERTAFLKMGLSKDHEIKNYFQQNYKIPSESSKINLLEYRIDSIYFDSERLHTAYVYTKLRPNMLFLLYNASIGIENDDSFGKKYVLVMNHYMSMLSKSSSSFRRYYEKDGFIYLEDLCRKSVCTYPSEGIRKIQIIRKNPVYNDEKISLAHDFMKFIRNDFEENKGKPTYEFYLSSSNPIAYRVDSQVRSFNNYANPISEDKDNRFLWALDYSISENIKSYSTLVTSSEREEYISEANNCVTVGYANCYLGLF